MNEPRRAQLERNLGLVRQRIEMAAKAAGRSSTEITLIVVTKYFPASDVEILAQLGVQDVGENKHQEAQAKAEQCSGLPIRWHYIGGMQSNKAAQIARYVDAVHSVDRLKLLPRLDLGASGRDDLLDVLIQVNLDPPRQADSSRQGVGSQEVITLAKAISETAHLRLRGVMGIAPLDLDPEPAFTQLARVSAQLRNEFPEATWISAGMSADLESAIAAGATHVRVGSGILGQRPQMK